jgi:hypothetical protein
MAENGSFRLRYVGQRFEGTRLPVDVLADLPAFRELIVTFARAEWRRNNTHRKRLPKGFDASLALDLVAIEDGSAVPVLKWNRETTQAYLPGFSDQIEDTVKASFGQVVLLFSDAAAGQFPAALEPAQIAALNKFGANLRDNERIEFEGSKNPNGSTVYLNSSIRKNLIGSLRGRYSGQIEDVGTLLGGVATPDGDNSFGYIVVQTAVYGELRIPVSNETLKSDFDGNIGQPIELNLQAEFDSSDRVSGITEVRNVSLIDEQIASQITRCRDRLNQVAALKDGWHDGAGIGPSMAAVSNAMRFLEVRFSFCDLYRIYPTDTGGVIFELRIKNWDVSLEFLSDGKVQMDGLEVVGEQEVGPSIYDGISNQLLADFDGLIG